MDTTVGALKVGAQLVMGTIWLPRLLCNGAALQDAGHFSGSGLP